MRTAVVLILCVGAATCSRPFFDYFPRVPEHVMNATADDPLYLTPYISNGNISKARQLSRVNGIGADQITSYAGYLTVNATHNSNMFFWYFPAAQNVKTAPLILWLQGGPGGSSLFGLFVENGPFSVDRHMRLVPRNYSWHMMHAMIYIDNPVGTGFSFTEDDAGYATNEEEVARDLYEALRQFFTLFPEHQQRGFYVTGESYAGKYVPAISYKIHTENQRQTMQIPLKGLAIGDGLCDPVDQLDYGDFLYNVGLITDDYRKRFRKLEEDTRRYIEHKDYHNAFLSFSQSMGYYSDATGLNFVYNYLLQDTPEEFAYYPVFVTQPSTRRALHVGNNVYNDGTEVYQHLEEDFMHSVRDKIVALLDNDYEVMIYNGQMDVIIDYIGTENFVAKLPWKGQAAFNASARHVWRVSDEVAGYVRHVKPLTQVMVRNAGHILPFDQPRWAFDMITRFTHDKEHRAKNQP